MGISAEAMRKLVREKMMELKFNIDKDPKFKAMFEKNFELAYADDGLNIKVLSNYKSTIPEKVTISGIEISKNNKDSYYEAKGLATNPNYFNIAAQR